MRINPVFKNELRLNTRTMKTSWSIFVYDLILVLVSIFTFSTMVEQARYGGSVNYRSMLVFYVIMAYAEFLLLVLIVPGLAAGGISGERERQTLDILLLTKMSPWQIIIGKLEASLSTMMILIISSFPVLSLVFVYGGVRVWDLLLLFLMLFVTAIFLGSIGLFYSAFLKKTTNATILMYATELFIFIGTFALLKGVYMTIYARASAIGGYTEPSIGGLIYVLLLNPVIGFFELVNKQVGNNQAVLQISRQFGVQSGSLILENWIVCSLAVQLLISLLLLYLAARRIDPLRVK